MLHFPPAGLWGGGNLSFSALSWARSASRLPTGSYPFYVFPQVSLGQIIRTAAPSDPLAGGSSAPGDQFKSVATS